ncbi:hypothetical protein GQX74_013874 [Glossina fuscipes]|nr:hypothetical protein GQX74_013874 [Glossina fuscipes]
MQTRTVTTEKKKNMQTTTKYTNARRKKQTSNCVNTALQITTCTCHMFTYTTQNQDFILLFQITVNNAKMRITDK